MISGYPNLTRLSEIFIQKYESYLPTAFDESMSILQKLNKIIQFMNETGILVNSAVDLIEASIQSQNIDIVALQEEVLDFRTAISLQQSDFETEITDNLLPANLDTLLSDWFDNGRLAEIINTILFESKRDKSVLISEYDITDSLRQMITGLAPILSMIGIASVSPLKTTFMSRGKQLFNKATAIIDSYVLLNTGASGPNTTYYASEYILVTGGETYHKNDDLPHYAWYTDQFVYISGGTNGLVPQRILVAPSNARYLRVTVNKNHFNAFMLNVGSVSLPFEDYAETINPINLGSVPAKTISGQLTKQQTDFIVLGRNIFDKSKVTNGFYVDFANGSLTANATYSASDFIPVLPNTEYARTFKHQTAFYTINKTYISGINSTDQNVSFTTPSTCAFVRVTVSNVFLDSYQLELGSVSTPFEAYKFKLVGVEVESVSQGSNDDEILVFLPSTICVAVGRTLEIYNSQAIWTGNLDNYHVKWEATIGKSLKRKWMFTGVTEKIGTHTLKLFVYNNNMELITTATTTIKVVDATIINDVNLLTIGDSLSNGKPWLPELKILSPKIKYVGTRTWGVPAGEGHEGRSGASSAWYLANSTYTYETNGVGPENPFWNPATSAFDFGYYKTNYNKNPNAVQIYLGTNGIGLDPTSNATNIKGIVDGIRLNDATIPIFVVYTLYRGSQDGIGKQLSSDGYSAGSGVWKLEEDRKVFNLMVKVNDLLKTYPNLHFVPIALTHDSEYNFGDVQTPVNARSTTTVSEHIEATHPQQVGYLQMADIMFSTIASNLT